jgi:hypothetical protein
LPRVLGKARTEDMNELKKWKKLQKNNETAQLGIDAVISHFIQE